MKYLVLVQILQVHNPQKIFLNLKKHFVNLTVLFWGRTASWPLNWIYPYMDRRTDFCRREFFPQPFRISYWIQPIVKMTLSDCFALFVKFFFLLTPPFVMSAFLSVTKDNTIQERNTLAIWITLWILIISGVLLFFGGFIFKIFETHIFKIS